MSKTSESPQGSIALLEDLKSVERKIKRAVTDNEAEVRYDPAAKPGVSNLLELLAAVTGEKPNDLAGRYSQYGPLKSDVAGAVVALLEPIQARYRELAADPGYVGSVLAAGAAKASVTAGATLERAYRAIGLLPAS